jgi:hypothetical protein
MAFQTIEKTTLGAEPVRGCAVSVYSMGKRLFFDLRLGTDVMERLGVGHGDRLVVERGDGKHVNQLRLKPGTMSGFKIGYMGKNGRAGHIRLASLVTKQKHRITAAPHKFNNGYLYVELPDWARAKPAKAV